MFLFRSERVTVLRLSTQSLQVCFLLIGQANLGGLKVRSYSDHDPTLTWMIQYLLAVPQEHRLSDKGILGRFPPGRDCSCESQEGTSNPADLRHLHAYSPCLYGRHFAFLWTQVACIWTQRYISNFVAS